MTQSRFERLFRCRLTNRITLFARDEDGSLIMFSLFIFLCMIMFGGIAVDVMLFENERTHLQNSTDRAVLAAANLDQTVDPKTVVVDYLAKVGINIDRDDVEVTEIGSFPVVTGRQVSINVNGTFRTLLMDMVGVDTLPLGARSQATEAINDVEVSLVLDVSGSMGSNSKLTRMQDAANDFVEQILAGAEDGRVSLSLVPYSTQVSAGSDLLSLLNTHHNHSYSNCVNFESSSFDTTAFDHTTSLSQTAHFDPWRSWRSSRSPRNFVCRNEAYFDILPWQNDVTTITDQIDDFEAGGNTSIDVAVKWGAALLDPSMQGQLTSLQASGDVPPEFVQRPFAFNRPDTLKFIVVMTDGINTTQYMLRDQYKTGQSPVYRFNDSANGNAKHYSVDDQEHHDSDGDGDWYEDYFWVSQRRFDDDIFGATNSGLGTDVVRLNWIDVWAEMSMSWRAYNLYYAQRWRSNDYYNNYYSGSSSPLTNVSASQKDSRLDDICQAAKDQNVVIFAIGFEVTDASAQVMSDCASTPSHFYRVEGLDIEFAFASIANKINQLKLTE